MEKPISFSFPSHERSPLRVSFTDRNEVQAIHVGEATFATGGGDLWTAEFAAAGDLSQRIEVRAGEAATPRGPTPSPAALCAASATTTPMSQNTAPPARSC